MVLTGGIEPVAFPGPQTSVLPLNEVRIPSIMVEKTWSKWSRRVDSSHRPPPYESVAQPPCSTGILEAGEGIEPIVDAFKERRPAIERTRRDLVERDGFEPTFIRLKGGCPCR